MVTFNYDDLSEYTLTSASRIDENVIKENNLIQSNKLLTLRKVSEKLGTSVLERLREFIKKRQQFWDWKNWVLHHVTLRVIFTYFLA